MKLLIINGPNLNLLGLREPTIYGTKNYAALVAFCENACREAGFGCEVFQSNHEGAIVDEIQAAYGVYDGIVINPAAYTHTSVALHDALEAAELPVVEVHLSNVHRREEFRHHSFVSPQATAVIAGAGAYGYVMAVDFLAQHLAE